MSALNTELADFAFLLERRGRHDAAEVVNAIRLRISAIEANLRTDTVPAPR